MVLHWLWCLLLLYICILRESEYGNERAYINDESIQLPVKNNFTIML